MGKVRANLHSARYAELSRKKLNIEDLNIKMDRLRKRDIHVKNKFDYSSAHFNNSSNFGSGGYGIELI